VTRRTLLLALTVVTLGLLLWPRKPVTWPIRNAPPGAGPIVCFGDSLTRGHGAEPKESYPAVLAGLLGREVLNRGRDGETSESALERLDSDVLAAAPSVVVITLGGNDMMQRLRIEVTVASLRKIFDRILSANAMVVFLAIHPPFVGDERMHRVKDLCRELGVLYLDSVMNGMWGDRKLMSDNIHPNAAGYRLMAERARDALEGRL
jgi:lysophospholipase L1-like esterase